MRPDRNKTCFEQIDMPAIRKLVEDTNQDTLQFKVTKRKKILFEKQHIVKKERKKRKVTWNGIPFN